MDALQNGDTSDREEEGEQRVKARPEYIAPTSLNDALAALAGSEGRYTPIAGGTDLLPRMRAGEVVPSALLDMRLLPLKHIGVENGQVAIGACVTHTAILESRALREVLPALAEACQAIAGPPVRNRGTLGGNLVNASPAGDTPLPLLVYDANLVLSRNGSERVVPLPSFFRGPGQTVLDQDELLTEVRVPVPPPGTAAFFTKLGKRHAMAIAVVSVATRLSLDRYGRVDRARIALGSVAPTPFRAIDAEAVLEGTFASEDQVEQAAKVASQEASPISDIRASADYRLRMVSVLVRRALVSTLEILRGDNDCARD
jgi:CO/xanthine dehydrogenase FAD-binding subunit